MTNARKARPGRAFGITTCCWRGEAPAHLYKRVERLTRSSKRAQAVQSDERMEIANGEPEEDCLEELVRVARGFTFAHRCAFIARARAFGPLAVRLAKQR